MITCIVADDWEGLYVEGKLKTESHSLNVREVLSLLVGIKIERVSRIYIEQDYMEEIGSLPSLLSDLPKNKLY